MYTDFNHFSLLEPMTHKSNIAHLRQWKSA